MERQTCVPILPECPDWDWRVHIQNGQCTVDCSRCWVSAAVSSAGLAPLLIPDVVRPDLYTIEAACGDYLHRLYDRAVEKGHGGYSPKHARTAFPSRMSGTRTPNSSILSGLSWKSPLYLGRRPCLRWQDLTEGCRSKRTDRFRGVAAYRRCLKGGVSVDHKGTTGAGKLRN